MTAPQAMQVLPGKCHAGGVQLHPRRISQGFFVGERKAYTAHERNTCVDVVQFPGWGVQQLQQVFGRWTALDAEGQLEALHARVLKAQQDQICWLGFTLVPNAEGQLEALHARVLQAQ
jgi:hypothetical protein